MNKRSLIKIGTRGSKLALAQSSMIREMILEQHPHITVELVVIKTKGDRIIDSPLSKIGGKGLFVKEIEEALLDKSVDIAVHSIKDVPAQLPDGLCMPFYPERENPADAFLSCKFKRLVDLPSGARVGTGSLRRSSQILNKRADLDIIPIRGNVDTRIKRLESGDLDAIILAASGLNRLGLSSKITEMLSFPEYIPAVGQGALGIEIRRDDKECSRLLEFMNHYETAVAVSAERAFLHRLEGGCQVPLGAYACIDKGKIVIHGMVSDLTGTRVIKESLTGSIEHPVQTGKTLAERLLGMGADKILAEVYSRQ